MAESEEKGKVHKVIANAPELPDNLDFAWNVYNDLSGCRNECDCIPISEIKAYCEFYGIADPLIRSFLARIITGLNREMVEYKEEKRKREERVGKLKK